MFESKYASEKLMSVNVSVFVSGNPHFDAVLIMSPDSILFVDRDDDTVLKAYSLKQVDMCEDPQHPRAVVLEHRVNCSDAISEVSSTTGPISWNQGSSRDVPGRQNSGHCLSDLDLLVLTLFMDPVYTRPLLSRFKLFKGGF